MKIKQILILLIIVFNSCKKSDVNSLVDTEQITDENEITISQSQFESTKMMIGKATAMDFFESIHTTGKLTPPPNKIAVVNTMMEGYVQLSFKTIGDWVNQGEVLAKLKNPEYLIIQQNYLKAKKQYLFQEKNFNRVKSLSDENITSKKDFQQAENEFFQAKLEYESFRGTLKMMHINPDKLSTDNLSGSINILAPISGYITQSNITIGKLAEATDELFEIIDTRSLELELSIFEKDVAHIREGMEIHFKIPESSEKSVAAKIIKIGRSVNPVDRTILIRGKITDRTDLNLVSGMFVEADIYTHKTQGWGLPVESVINLNDNSYILILTNQTNDEYTFKKIEVEEKQKQNDFVQVSLEEANLSDAKILTRGAFELIVEE